MPPDNDHATLLELIRSVQRSVDDVKSTCSTISDKLDRKADQEDHQRSKDRIRKLERNQIRAFAVVGTLWTALTTYLGIYK